MHELPSSHGLGLSGLHTPAAQESPVVQALLSSQGAKFAVKVQPLARSQASSVQGLPSTHVNCRAKPHVPPWQTSPMVHALLSWHTSALLVCVQPACGSQASVVHTLLSSHDVAVPARQTPSLHRSPTVQALPSLHAVVNCTCWQPSAALQLSWVHGAWSSQFNGVPGTHAPPLHWSPLVQASPSEQGAALFACWQPFVRSQLSVVHGLLSSQEVMLPGVHAVALQMSFAVHGLPSSHVAALGRCTQPVASTHVSSVQGLSSAHCATLPRHLPLLHKSSALHFCPSSQTVPSALLCAQPLAKSQLSLVQTLASSQSTLEPPAH